MKLLKMIVFSLSLSLFLSACGSEKEETVSKVQSEENKTENKTEEKVQPEQTEEKTESVKLDIPNQDSYKELSVLFTKKDDPSLDQHKVMTEPKDIRTFIDKVDKIEVKKNNDPAELLEYSMAMVEETKYFFQLTKDENNKFSVFFFEDGQVVLLETDLLNKSKEDQEKIYISKAKHLELLQELKDSLSLPF